MSTDLYNATAFTWNIVYVGTTFISSLLTGIVSAIGLVVLIRKRHSLRAYPKSQ